MIGHALRHVLTGIAVFIVLALGVAPVAAGTATEAIKSTIKQMFWILNDEELKAPGRAAEQRQQLEKVIGNRIAYDEMAKRSLGSQWTQLNDEERQEFVRLYAQLLRDTYSTSRVLTNYLSMTETQRPDTHRLVQEQSQAVQKGRPARPQQATRRSVPSAVR
ncbi:MAG: ABC transporter substrate-binding protein [Nitrospiraceae bacterium]